LSHLQLHYAPKITKPSNLHPQPPAVNPLTYTNYNRHWMPNKVVWQAWKS
jgi:hypothetical protein